MPKLRIEEAAARRQARIDRGEESIVGVNKYQRATDERRRRPRHRQHARCASSRSRGSKRVRATRDAAQASQAALDALTDAARSGQGNLLELADRGDARARHGRRNLGRAGEGVHAAIAPTIRSVSGVYGALYEGDEGYRRIQREVEAFARDEGRRPRMLVAKLGQDGHDRGAKVIATAFADLGFDVDIGPLFQTPEEAARQAIENDVHVDRRLEPGGGPHDPGAGADRRR